MVDKTNVVEISFKTLVLCTTEIVEEKSFNKTDEPQI